MENEALCPIEYPNSAIPLSTASKVAPSPFKHKEIKKSLEDIVSNSGPDKKSHALENMLSDKAKTLKASVVALLEEIKLRQDLNTSHFSKMDFEIRKLHSELMNLDNIVLCYPDDLFKDVDEARNRIKADVLELEKEKRSEGLECWRDLMFLKKYLMGALKDYWELARRRGMLESDI